MKAMPTCRKQSINKHGSKKIIREKPNTPKMQVCFGICFILVDRYSSSVKALISFPLIRASNEKKKSRRSWAFSLISAYAFLYMILLMNDISLVETYG